MTDGVWHRASAIAALVFVLELGNNMLELSNNNISMAIELKLCNCYCRVYVQHKQCNSLLCRSSCKLHLGNSGKAAAWHGRKRGRATNGPRPLSCGGV